MTPKKILCPICETPAHLFLAGLYDDRYGCPGLHDLYQCPSCRHHHLATYFSPKQLADLYARYYPRKEFQPSDYRPMPSAAGIRGWWNGERRAFSLVPPGVRVLDVGCGLGESLGYHAARGCRAVGAEVDPNVLPLAQKVGLDIRIGVFGKEMFPSEKFDCITLDQVVEHSADPLRLFRDAAHLLTGKGKLFLTTPNPCGWGARRFGRRWLHWHAPFHLQFFTRASLEEIARKSGFRLQSLTTHTSSEWLFYQRLQNLLPATPETPSPLFSAQARWEDQSAPVQRGREKVERQHRRWKWHHLATRFFDACGDGDNFLGVLEKVELA